MILLDIRLLNIQINLYFEQLANYIEIGYCICSEGENGKKFIRLIFCKFKHYQIVNDMNHHIYYISVLLRH